MQNGSKTISRSALGPQARRHRARRLLALERERRAIEAELERRGCRFVGAIEPRHRRLSWALDRQHAETFALWEAA